MIRLPLAGFIILGLLAWGIPAVLVAGPSAVLLALATAAPVWYLNRSPASRATRADAPQLAQGVCAWVVCFTLIYLLFDGMFGRELFRYNQFLHGQDAFALAGEATNANEGVGRNLSGLLGGVLMFMPFALFDISWSAPGKYRRIIWGVVLLYIFYESAYSRSYLLMAVLAVAFGRQGASLAENYKRAFGVACLATGLYLWATTVRGNFNHVIFSNPLFDDLAFPYINLSLLLNANCGSAHSYDFVLEILKKAVPGFIIPKHVFLFNREMTACTYPWVSYLDSVSVFTYLGEIYYYTPSILTALSAGCIIGVLARSVNRRLVRHGLTAARIYGGLMAIEMCRAGLNYLCSFLLFLYIFLIVWPWLSGARVLALVRPAPPIPDSALEGEF